MEIRKKEKEGGRAMPISEVYNMDCMEYMKGIPDKFFDLAVVDPPYGIDAAFTPCSRISKYGQPIGGIKL